MLGPMVDPKWRQNGRALRAVTHFWEDGKASEIEAPDQASIRDEVAGALK